VRILDGIGTGTFQDIDTVSSKTRLKLQPAQRACIDTPVSLTEIYQFEKFAEYLFFLSSQITNFLIKLSIVDSIFIGFVKLTLSLKPCTVCEIDQKRKKKEKDAFTLH